MLMDDPNFIAILISGLLLTGGLYVIIHVLTTIIINKD